jgi:hypothetical protein
VDTLSLLVWIFNGETGARHLVAALREGGGVVLGERVDGRIVDVRHEARLAVKVEIGALVVALKRIRAALQVQGEVRAKVSATRRRGGGWLRLCAASSHRRARDA